jgi:hypothetical protein
MSADQETRLWLTMLRDYIETRIKAALPFVRDGKLDLSSKNIVGTLPATSGGSGTNTGGDPTGAWQDLGADTAIPTLAGNSVDLHYRGITGG